MDMIIEVLATSISTRAKEDVVNEVRKVLGGVGLEVADTEILAPESGATAALAATGSSDALYTGQGTSGQHGRARVRLYTS